MYDVAVTLLTGAGYEHYEISNFALPERRCRHNMFYWNNLPYLGFGAGAVTYLDGWRRSNVRQPAEYVRRVRGGENLMQEAEKLSAHRELAETLILGLRLVKGIDLGALERRFPGIALDALKGSLAPLAEQGLLERRNGNIRLSADGLRLANKVFSEILDLPLSTVL
jgi:oxygen-independent coproporphyrinogen-3 oxidase